MRGPLNRRPSPALVISIIALLMAMVGTGYAAFKLPKSSVGTKQLKKNSVTGAKVKNGTLTGQDINLKKLGTVPAAEIANSANALAAPEAVHLVGAAGQPSFLNGSKNFPEKFEGANLQSAGYYKDHEGIVHLQGVAVAGTEVAGTGYAPVFQLPPGYRPTPGTLLIFAGSSSVALIAGANTNLEGFNVEGDVLGTKEEAVLLDGFTFRAES